MKPVTHQLPDLPSDRCAESADCGQIRALRSIHAALLLAWCGWAAEVAPGFTADIASYSQPDFTSDTFATPTRNRVASLLFRTMIVE